MTVDLITAEQGFRRVGPGAPPAAWEGFVSQFGSEDMQKIRVDIRTLAEFFGQLAVESGGFTTIEENLNYSAASLRRVFGRYYDGEGQPSADDHARNPEKIANWVYNDANRINELGNTKKGDGWHFRGSGPIQITGRSNATSRAQKAGMKPEDYIKRLRDDWGFGWQEAASYFVRRVLPGWDGSTEEATTRVNGGHHGLPARILAVDGAYSAMQPMRPLLRDTWPSRFEIQSRLTILEAEDGRPYYEEKIDGIWGRNSKASLKKFQAENGLMADGTPGPASFAALDRAAGLNALA